MLSNTLPITLLLVVMTLTLMERTMVESVTTHTYKSGNKYIMILDQAEFELIINLMILWRETLEGFDEDKQRKELYKYEKDFEL